MLKVIAVVVLFLGTGALAQAPTKIKIYVNCTCNDMVGARYATALRDVIARSPRYQLTSAAIEGTGKDEIYSWVLNIVSVDDGNNNEGVSSAISVVLELGGYLSAQRVQTCGRAVIENCAATTLANADADIQSEIETFQKSLKTPKP